jgi:Flp pilus assembly protein TadD
MQRCHMPLRRLSAAEAFDNLKANPYGDWPRTDAPDNRFASFADPFFKPGFLLEPGQRIFTIGSCFARNIEEALAARGFEIPMMEFPADTYAWGGDPKIVLNTYVPAVIAPQIRWAFGLDAFDIARHGVEIRPGRYVDLQVTAGFRPMPAAAVIARREWISDIYRKLAGSHVVLITLGLIEAWFDNNSGLYINSAPPKSASAAQPGRFELHIQDYNEVLASLSELVALLGQVCPSGYRMILTVSPVPLTSTFTDGDVAVANTYSKSVLRAAAGALAAEYRHIEYFPSYESVMLTERSIAFTEDQIHVTQPMVQFNVDRMIRRYLKAPNEEIAGDIIARAREERRAGRGGVALKLLQTAWTDNSSNPELTVALADAQLRNRNGAIAEQLLIKHLANRNDAQASLLLARHYNATGRFQQAAALVEAAAEAGINRLQIAEQRIIAYYNLGRYEEGWAVLARMRFPPNRAPLFIYWKARFSERLNRPAEAEAFYRECNGMAENALYMTSFAEFLAAQGRWDEVQVWVDRILLIAPANPDALRLRRRNRHVLGGSLFGDVLAAGRERRLGAMLAGIFRGRLKQARPGEL